METNPSSTFLIKSLRPRG